MHTVCIKHATLILRNLLKGEIVGNLRKSYCEKTDYEFDLQMKADFFLRLNKKQKITGNRQTDFV